MRRRPQEMTERRREIVRAAQRRYDAKQRAERVKERARKERQREPRREAQRRYVARSRAAMTEEEREEKLAHKRAMERLRFALIDARRRLAAAKDTSERAALKQRIARLELQREAKRHKNPGGRPRKRKD